MTVVVILCMFLLSFANSGFALSDKLAQSLRTEEAIISDMENFIESLDSVLRFARKNLYNFKLEHSDAMENPDVCFSNELNRFLLFKRLVSDVDNLTNNTFEVAGKFKSKVDLYKEGINFPTENDLTSSALSIARLQKDRNFKTNKLAQGFFGSIKRR